MTDVVVVDAIRTPVGKKDGSLANVHPVDLLVPILTHLVERNGVESKYIDDVITGCATMTQDQGVDRKSTRLNSSHVSISYAVFCLKKKIKLININNFD